jgi:hypothetical protein
MIRTYKTQTFNGDETMKTEIQNAASAIAKRSSFETVAAILNDLLSCWDDPDTLTDIEADEATVFFETLCELRPECVKIAQGVAQVMTISLEKNHPGLGFNKPCWVARDSDGEWRSYASKHFSETAGGSVASMWHADEVLAVKEFSDHAKVVISYE